ncbi:hypothetical protein B0I27_10722 [Arcticibacter pallidicorallinus]|uniref:DUF5683 domain-containing protein n=1 Tax=Arcticibacter pallidicorallinus TaxID=1259464 RepID=A0A2T0U0I1_9SPHI|nr:DUF5683 domain-containing protein [Arcticibacter pallidicorallinus]PRY51437.1 hypothetical protein B0I27_10722 [Arcticibacter pallidicorallinus]
MMFTTGSVFSQTDTVLIKVDSAMANPDSRQPKTVVPKDTVVRVAGETPDKPAVVKDSARLAIERMPGQAARRSAIVPGLGQIKNGRWWKVPFIYGGLVGTALVFEFNQRYYRDILTELQVRYNEDNNIPDDREQNPKYQNLDETALQSGKDFYRRNRDLSVLVGLGVYAINIIDAYVDAKFFRWDVSDELSFRVKPSLQSLPTHASVVPVPGIKISLAL